MLKTSDSNHSNRTLRWEHIVDAAHGDTETRAWNPGVPCSQVLAVFKVLSAAGVPPRSQRGLRSSLACGERESGKKKGTRTLRDPGVSPVRPCVTLGPTPTSEVSLTLPISCLDRVAWDVRPSSSCPPPGPPAQAFCRVPWCRWHLLSH